MKYALFLSFSLWTTCLYSDQQDPEGKTLFRNNCAACHNIDQKLVGPALKDVHTRRDSAWLYSFIKGSQQMVADGDSTAVALFNEFNQIIMPNQPVDDQQIGLILDYIRSQSAPLVADDNPIKRPQPKWANNSSRPMRFTDVAFWIPFTISVIAVIFILYYFTFITDLRREDQAH